jgi:ABC-2 type transport system ATP-binding protein
MIKVEELSRTYRNVVAVNNVSFEIAPTEIVGLLGQNGAGKTTILKMLTGYLEPTAGKITINGLDVCSQRLSLQSEIGYLPENSPLYPDMTVLEYLDYVADLRGVPPAKKQERLIDALKKTGIVDVAMSPIRPLSRGYKQRLGVAQAILNKPAILILDEPTNGLDPSQILEMRLLIRELAASATVIISTHILQEVQAICGRVIIIDRGRLALDASREALQVSDRLTLEIDGVLDDYASLLREFDLKVLDCQTKSSQNCYTLTAPAKDLHELTPALVHALSGAGCKIYAVHRQERDLETIFREIIAGAREGGASETP